MPVQLPDSSSAMTLAVPDPVRPTPPVEGLMDLLEDLGLVDSADLSRLRIIHDQLTDVGEPGALTGRLVGDGLLTADQARRLLEGLGKVTPTCFRCTRHNAFDQAEFTGVFSCQHCGLPVSLVDGSAGFDDALFPNPPARVLDKIVEKLALAGGKLTVEQVEALKLLRLQSVPRPTFLQVIEREGLVPLKRLLRMRRRAELLLRDRVPFWRELQWDFELARFLSRVRLASARQLEWALRDQLQATMGGTYLPLRDRLASHQVLTPRQLEQLLPARPVTGGEEDDMLTQFDSPFSVSDAPEAPLPDWEDSLAELVEELHEESNSHPVLPPPSAPEEEVSSPEEGAQ